MKRQLIKFFTILSVIIACSAAANAQFRYAAIAGPEFTNLKFKQDLVDVSQTLSYQVGVQGEMMFPGLGFGIDLGLLYNQLGAKVNLGQRKIWAWQGYGDERVRLHTLQIPLHLRFKWTRMDGLEDIVAPFVYGGPDFNILVGHGHCDAFKYAGGDLSLSVGGGVELFKKWQVSFQYSWGMTYALKTVLLDNYSARSRSYTLRVAYFF
ncbi:MAG: PorT family protein [Muribaculaceae bacterium]|nr:PorT family protein [Muribaculaceae bacterium]MDE5595035.1 PorT family protein [Muribaculaceae bacterium]